MAEKGKNIEETFTSKHYRERNNRKERLKLKISPQAARNNISSKISLRKAANERKKKNRLR